MLNLKPVGTYHLQLDTNISANYGADDLLAHMEQALGISAENNVRQALHASMGRSGACGTAPAPGQRPLLRNMTAGSSTNYLRASNKA